MKIFLISLLLVTTCFADVPGKMYFYTYTTKTHKCAVDIFVPDTGSVKVEKSCFLIK